MNTLWQLFLTFLKMGAISFGGGYAVMPMIEGEVLAHGWMNHEQFAQAVSLAGMSPGPIATNTATLIGYQTAGIAGAAAATAGIVLPSLFIIIIVVAFCIRFYDRKWVKSSFYGLRAIVTGLIAYAALHFGFLSHKETLLTWTTVATLLICAGSLYGIIRYKLHPVVVIAAAGIAGILFF